MYKGLAIFFLQCVLVLPTLGHVENSQNFKISASLSDYGNLSNIDIEKFFQDNLSCFSNIVYTITPMGLVISLNGFYFYDEGKDTLNEHALCILDIMAELIKKIDKPCIVESTTYPNAFNSSVYKSNWELSVVRANNIANYLIFAKDIPSQNIRANGFGEFMPTLGYKNLMQERIDFIIFNYKESFKQ